MGKKKNKSAEQSPGGVSATSLSPSDWRQIDANPLKVLIGKDLANFSEWENKPTLFKADDFRKRLFKGLVDIKTLEKTLQSDVSELLTFGMDIRAVKCKDGQRVPDPDSIDVSEAPQLYHQEGYTLQFLQPQRFEDKLWRLLAALEAQFGCLVGCNAYLTPKDTQGLAPHHDDVELFVCQTEGSKRWRLYAPKDGHSLPFTSSKDFTEDVIGEPVMDVTLEVGDVLYMPRGTIHQAVASAAAASSHLTISTYQHWSQAVLAATVLQQGSEEQAKDALLPLDMRKGLAPRLLFDTALEARLNGGVEVSTVSKTAATSLACALRALADQLESKPEMIHPATLSLAEGFMRDRLPPHPDQLAPQGPPPTQESRLYCRGRRWFMTKMGSRMGEKGEEQYVKLCSCLSNERMTHMIQLHDDSDDEDFDEDEDGNPFMFAESDEDGEEDGEEAPEAVDLSKAAQSAIEKLTKSEKEQTGNGAGSASKGKGKRKREAEEGEEEEEKPKKKVGKGAKSGGDVGGDVKVAGVEEGHVGEGKEGGKKKEARKSEEAEDEDEEDDEEDEDEDEEADEVEDDDGLSGLLFPADAAEALSKVLCTSGKEGVAIMDLPLEDTPTKMHFAFALWAEGVASTKPVLF